MSTRRARDARSTARTTGIGDAGLDVVRPADAGWTLIELVIVILLITVLAGISLANYRHAVTGSQEAVMREDLFAMRDAIDQYYADKAQYPASIEALATDGYLRKIPEDPFTKSASTWVVVPAEPDPNNPNAEPGVFDVKSGSEATAMDGTKYADW